jgi:hypothetical protein
MAKLRAKIVSCLRRFADGLPRGLLRRGSALGLVLVFMTFMLILGTGLLTVGQYMIVQSRTVGEADSYYYAAESAAQLAAQLLLREVSTAGADGTTGGVLVETVASVPYFNDPEDTDEIAADPDIEAGLESIIASLGGVYGDIKTTVESYPPGSATPGFNGRAVELTELWLTSEDGAYTHKIGDALDHGDLLRFGVATVAGLFDAENYTEDDYGDRSYLELAVYLANPNFRIVARSGGRVVEVNTNVALEFNIGVDVATMAATSGGSAPARTAALEDEEISGYIGAILGIHELVITISGDSFKEDAEDILDEDYLATDGIVHDIPDHVRFDLDSVTGNTLTFIVSGTSPMEDAKQGPVRITLPGDILASETPLNVTRNEEAVWDIGGGVVSDRENVLEGFLANNSGPAYQNDPAALAFLERFNVFLKNRIAAAQTIFDNGSAIIDRNVPLSALVNGSVPAGARRVYVDGTLTLSGDYPDLEYIECTNLNIEGVVRCPKLKAVYVSSNIIFGGNNSSNTARLNPLAYDARGYPVDPGTRTKLVCSNVLRIYCSPNNATQINWCEIYTSQMELYYNSGKFISNSAFYLGNGTSSPNLRFDGTPNPDHGNVYPQFYFAANGKMNIPNSNAMIGCFFVPDGRQIFVDNSPNAGAGQMEGLFVGGFDKAHGNGAYPKDVYQPISMDDLRNGVPDQEVVQIFEAAELGSPPPPPAAYIDGEPQITGTVGEEIEDVTFTVTPENDAINETKANGILNGPGYDPSAMFWNVPGGITIQCTVENKLTLKFTVSGVPETPLKEPIDIIIPGSFMEKGQAINVAIKEDAFWDIIGVIETTEEIRVATSSVTGSLNGRGAELHDVTGSPGPDET